MRKLLAILMVAVAPAIAAAQSPDRSKPPVVGSVPAVTLPAVARHTLANGLTVWIVESHEVPVVQVNLIVKGTAATPDASGSAGDPAGKAGLASLTAAMLTEGAGSRTSLELADAVDFLGADLSAGSSWDAMAVRLHVPVARLGEALPLMADVALRPRFDGAELDRLRQQRITSLTQAKDDASSLAAVAFARVLYGGSRYGTAAMGTAASLARITADDLRAFHGSRFVPSTSTLIVVGDIAAADALSLVQQHFGAWNGGASRPPAPGSTASTTPVRPAAARTRREVYLVDKPGAPQSQIRIGLMAAARSTPDYFPLVVMNTILGGSFSSRLNMNLREEHGYTYGASSSFDMRLKQGPFTAGAGVQTDKTSESLTEFFKELNAILQPVPGDELSRSKNYVALRYPGTFETTADIARRLEEAVVYGLPESYFANYVAGIERVTAADVERVAREYLSPSTVAVVVVGDRAVIEPGLRALGLGPINVLSPDEVFDEPGPVRQPVR